MTKILYLSSSSMHACLIQCLTCKRDPHTRLITQIENISTEFSDSLFVQVKLPPGVSCSHCVLQWEYNAGLSRYRYSVDSVDIV